MMKKILLALALIVISAPAFAQDVYVRGHTRRDGTYVQPHYRTAPDHTRANNYSTEGNTNPYTGQRGTRTMTPSEAYNSGVGAAGPSGYNNPYRANSRSRFLGE